MLIRQFEAVGKAIGGQKAKYKIFVDSQREYKQKYFIKVNIDVGKTLLEIAQNPEFIELVEFDEEQKYDYLFGLEGGNASNTAPMVNITWPHFDDKKNLTNPKKIVNLSMKVVNTKNKIPDSFNKNSLVIVFYSWIEQNHEPLRQFIIDYLIKAGANKSWGSNRERPKLIIFAIKTTLESESYYYPGQIPEFIRLYDILNSPQPVTTSITDPSSVCFCCGNMNSIVEQFNFGSFTIDQHAFRLGFGTKKNAVYQYGVCNNCRLLIQEGFTYVDTNLRFLAFYIKDGSKTIKVLQYLIPQIEECNLLSRTLQRLETIRIKTFNNEKQSITTEISGLQIAFKTADKDKKRKITTAIKDYESKLKDLGDTTSYKLSVEDLFSQLTNQGITFINVFFIETDLKQTPSNKEIIMTLIIDKMRVKELGEITSRMWTVDNSFRLWKLKNLVGNRFYLKYLRSILEKREINENDFFKLAYTNIKPDFKTKILEIDKKEYFQQKIRDFQLFYNFLKQSNTLKV